MSKAIKKESLYALGVLALIAFAMWSDMQPAYFSFSGCQPPAKRDLCVLFSARGATLWIRIVQTQVRRYLLAISVLMVLIFCAQSNFPLKHGGRALAVVFLLFSDAVHPHAVGLRFPVTGQGRGFSDTAMDQDSVFSNAIAAFARSDQ